VLAGLDPEPSPELAMHRAVGASDLFANRLRTPSCRAVSKARMIPPVVGPATRSTNSSPSVARPWLAKKPHSSLVAAGSWRTWNFST
jgi:hypothetical protein